MERRMCNIPKNEAINVAKRCRTAEDNEIIAAHRSLNTFVDEVQAGTFVRLVLRDEIQDVKEWKLLLRQEMTRRGIKSSAWPARQLAAT